MLQREYRLRCHSLSRRFCPPVCRRRYRAWCPPQFQASCQSLRRRPYRLTASLRRWCHIRTRSQHQPRYRPRFHRWFHRACRRIGRRIIRRIGLPLRFHRGRRSRRRRPALRSFQVVHHRRSRPISRCRIRARFRRTSPRSFQARLHRKFRLWCRRACPRWPQAQPPRRFRFLVHLTFQSRGRARSHQGLQALLQRTGLPLRFHRGRRP